LSSNEEEQKTNHKKGVYIPSWIFKLIVLLIIVAGSFWAGWHYGGNHQANKDKSQGFGSSLAPSFVRHQVLIGNVTSVSSTKIVVNTDSKTTGSAAINKSTIITNTKEQTVKISDIKSATRVVITAAINSNGSLTAQRILIL